MLAYLDCQCSLGTVYLSDSLVRGQKSPEDAVRDDIDLDDIDAAMVVDNEEDPAQLQIDNIDMEEMKDALSDDQPIVKPIEIAKNSTEQKESK